MLRSILQLPPHISPIRHVIRYPPPFFAINNQPRMSLAVDATSSYSQRWSQPGPVLAPLPLCMFASMEDIDLALSSLLINNAGERNVKCIVPNFTLYFFEEKKTMTFWDQQQK